MSILIEISIDWLLNNSNFILANYYLKIPIAYYVMNVDVIKILKVKSIRLRLNVCLFFSLRCQLILESNPSEDLKTKIKKRFEFFFTLNKS